jgi:uncharacterized protein (DUF433 family)
VSAFLLFVMLMGQPGIESGKPIIRNEPCLVHVVLAPARHGKPVIRN